MTQSANLPAPYSGINEQVPTAALESPFAQTLLNVNVTQAGISVRNGDSKYKIITFSGTAKVVNRMFPYGSTKLFNLVFNNSTSAIDVYDVDAGTVSYSTAASGNDDFHALFFNNYLFFFGEVTYVPGFVFDGTNFGATGWTGSNFNPVGGDVYKSRAYLIQKGQAAYWYTPISAITGAVTKVDLSSVITELSTLAIIVPITIADNVATDTYQAFVFFSGEVLFYAGPYPDSANWSLVGRARIGAPVNYNSYVTYQGDSLILSDNAIVSLRDLFLKGSSGALFLSVNSKVNKSWSQLMQAVRVAQNQPVGRLLYIRGIYDFKNDRIVITVPYYVASTGITTAGGFYFVFYCQLGAWYFHRSFGNLGASNVDIVQYKNKVLTLTGGVGAVMVYEKEGATGYTDRNLTDVSEVGYDYNMLSAPIPFPKTAVYEATQIEPILESDLYAQTNWNFVVDFGRQTSGDQTTDAATTNVAKPAVNVGMQNITFVQVKMSGTTVSGKTVGLDLYSYNIWYNQGETASR